MLLSNGEVSGVAVEDTLEALDALQLMVSRGLEKAIFLLSNVNC